MNDDWLLKRVWEIRGEEMFGHYKDVKERERETERDGGKTSGRARCRNLRERH